MGDLHAVTAYGAALLAVAMLLASAVGAAAGRPMRLWLDRVILATLAALLLAAASGLPLLVLVGAPRDALHVLYGLLAPAVLLGGRYLGRHGSIRRRSALLLLASAALLGLVYRLFTTAGPTA